MASSVACSVHHRQIDRLAPPPLARNPRQGIGGGFFVDAHSKNADVVSVRLFSQGVENGFK
jgi:hypothetical protein